MHPNLHPKPHLVHLQTLEQRASSGREAAQNPGLHDQGLYLVFRRLGVSGISVFRARPSYRSPERDRPSLRSHSMTAAEPRALARDSLRAESL